MEFLNIGAGLVPGGFLGVLFTGYFLWPVKCEVGGRVVTAFPRVPKLATCTNFVGTNPFGVVGHLSAPVRLAVGAVVGMVLSAVIGSIRTSIFG